MLVRFHHDRTFMEVLAKITKLALQNAFENSTSIDFVFFHDFHYCSFMMKFYKHPENLSMFFTIFYFSSNFSRIYCSSEFRLRTITSLLQVIYKINIGGEKENKQVKINRKNKNSSKSTAKIRKNKLHQHGSLVENRASVPVPEGL